MRWLIDATIGYPDGADLNFQTIIAGTRRPCQTVVYYRKFPISDIPIETAALTMWLYDRFVEKEKLLEIFYKTGKFPEFNMEGYTINENSLLRPRNIRLSNFKIIATDIVLAIMLYAAYCILHYVVTLFTCDGCSH